MRPREGPFPVAVEWRDGPAASPPTPNCATNRKGRDETELLHALTKALGALLRGASTESALQESFASAMVGLGAEKGFVVQVEQTEPLDPEILYATGLSAENEAACRALRSSPGLSPSLIRKAAEDGEPRLIENSQVLGLDATASLQDRPYSVLCAPVADSLTGACVAVLYFENEQPHAFGPAELEWLTAYATALGQALTLHLSDQQRLRELEAGGRKGQDGDGAEILGSSEATRRLVDTLNTLLPSTARPDAPPILVTGESGTGKELVARYLHHRSPRRGRGPFQSFNCSGLRGELAEARLFGHMRGAFTGAVSDAIGLFRAADKGTLLLDEIGEMPLEDQALLLRVLESRCVQPVGGTKEIPIDVQFILATNRKLEDEVAAGRFREDLYYRVNGLGVELAPLRDPARIADIRPLLAFHLTRNERGLKKKTRGLTRAALRALLQYSWPGNVRELNNVCTFLVTHAPLGSWIDVVDIQRHCPKVLLGPKNPNPEAYLEDESGSFEKAVQAFQRKLILERLGRHGGSVSAAASSLGLSKSTFYRYWADARRQS